MMLEFFVGDFSGSLGAGGRPRGVRFVLFVPVGDSNGESFDENIACCVTGGGDASVLEFRSGDGDAGLSGRRKGEPRCEERGENLYEVAGIDCVSSVCVMLASE